MALYEPATLKEWPTGWQIEYHIFNPNISILERKRLRFENIRKGLGSDAKARRHAKMYCDAVSQKLKSGWNPCADSKNAKSFHKPIDAFGVFLNDKELDLENEIFRHDTIRTYRSLSYMFITWLKNNNKENIYMGTFPRMNADRIGLLKVR